MRGISQARCNEDGATRVAPSGRVPRLCRQAGILNRGLSVASALPHQVHSELNAHNSDVTVADQMHKYWFKEYMA